jgi:hypothetical protein
MASFARPALSARHGALMHQPRPRRQPDVCRRKIRVHAAGNGRRSSEASLRHGARLAAAAPGTADARHARPLWALIFYPARHGQLPTALPDRGILRFNTHLHKHCFSIPRHLAKPNAPSLRVVGQLAEMAGMRHQRFRMLPQVCLGISHRRNMARRRIFGSRGNGTRPAPAYHCLFHPPGG